MNPVETEQNIRKLELMLYGGCPVRPDADYGRQQVGHMESVKSRSPEVRPATGSEQGEPESVAECYVTTEDGKMHVERPGWPEKTP